MREANCPVVSSLTSVQHTSLFSKYSTVFKEGFNFMSTMQVADITHALQQPAGKKVSILCMHKTFLSHTDIIVSC